MSDMANHITGDVIISSILIHPTSPSFSTLLLAHHHEQRNTYPAALNKDRHSRSGLASPTERDRKHGAGAHNWGAFSQEGEYEAMARRDADEEQEGGADENLADQVAELPSGSKVTGANTGGQSVEAVSPTSSMASFDSSTSAQNNEASVPKDIKQAPGMGGRRLSNVSDEEMAKARNYREGVRAQGGMFLHLMRGISCGTGPRC